MSVLFVVTHRSYSALHWWYFIQWCFDFRFLITKTKDDFFAFMMLMIVMLKTMFFCLMIIIHRAKKYVMKERCTWWEDRVWLYWMILFCSWLMSHRNWIDCWYECAIVVVWCLALIDSRECDLLEITTILIVLMRSQFFT